MSIDTYFCFCCLSTNDLSPLYHDADGDHGNMLLQLFNLNISYEDYEYDSYICKDCTQRLKDAAKFRAQVFDILNILQSNGLIELSNTDRQVIVKKVSTEGLIDADEKYDKLTAIDVVSYKLSPEDTQQALPVKKEPPPEPARPGAEAVKVKVTHYEVTEDLRCGVCAAELPNAYVYHAHMNQHFPNHICDTCGKGFLTEKRLKRHLPSHRTGPFKCQICEAEFTNYNTLNSHRQRKHGAVQLYRCPLCGARFPSLSRRAAHLARTHARAQLRYRCPVCDKRFLLAGNLSAHVRSTHQRVRRHECARCAGACRERGPHRAAHAGQSMFQCAQCPKRYPRKKALIVHMRTHTDDRRFSCEYCGKRFIQKCTLLVHLKTHNKTEKSNSCTVK